MRIELPTADPACARGCKQWPAKVKTHPTLNTPRCRVFRNIPTVFIQPNTSSTCITIMDTLQRNAIRADAVLPRTGSIAVHFDSNRDEYRMDRAANGHRRVFALTIQQIPLTNFRERRRLVSNRVIDRKTIFAAFQTPNHISVSQSLCEALVLDIQFARMKLQQRRDHFEAGKNGSEDVSIDDDRLNALTLLPGVLRFGRAERPCQEIYARHLARVQISRNEIGRASCRARV